MKHGNSDRNVTDADAVVDRRGPALDRIPRVDISGTDFELERGGDAVEHLTSIGLVGLLVGMEIDETGRDNQPGRVELLAAGKRAFSDRRNLSTPDADATNSIEPGFRVDDPSSRDHQVEVLRRKRRDRAQRNAEQSDGEQSLFHR